MAHIYLWLLAGAMLPSIPALSVGQDLPWVHSGDHSQISNLLRQLNRIPLHLCLNDRNDFQFPWERRSITQLQRTQRTCLHRLMLQQLWELFARERSQAVWSRPVLHQLLSGIHHSLEHLDRTQEENLACPDLALRLRGYFRRIHNYLKEKKYSPCAWEVVRVEILVRPFFI